MKRIVCTVTNDLNFDQRMIRICTSLTNAGYDVLLIGRRKRSSPTLEEKLFLQKEFSVSSKRENCSMLNIISACFFI